MCLYSLIWHLFRQESETEEREDDEYNSYDKDEGLVEEQPLFVENNAWAPWVIGGGFLSLGLIGSYYLIKNAGLCSRYLDRDDLWSSWKSEESYDTLLMLDPKHLANDLVRDINVVYYQEADPINCFFYDIQQERDTLLSWRQFRNIVRGFYLPVGSEFYTIEKRIKLLERLRKAAHFWRSQRIIAESASH